jgi:hypothetical protein
VVKKEPLRYYRPESLPMPAVKREPDLFRLDPVIHVVTSGGGSDDHMLCVSYRGVVLAWGAVPRFTISHRLLGRRATGVVTVVATTDGFVLREDMWKLIRAEQQALSRVDLRPMETSRSWAATSMRILPRRRPAHRGPTSMLGSEKKPISRSLGD